MRSSSFSARLLIAFALMIAAVLFLSATTRDAESSANAAIGIRVFEDPNDLGAASWYAEQCRLGVFTACGQTTPLIVDGYHGVRDGNSVYLHVAHLSPTQLQTVIVLFSLSRDAGGTGEAVLTQMLANVRFNDTMTDGRQRAALRRDTLRRAQLASIRQAVAAYQAQKRCSIDQSRGCVDDAQCPTDQHCGNFVPPLRSGSYIEGMSFSAWPSWQSALGAALGGTLPEDPGRPSATTPGTVDRFLGCGGAYDPITCWDTTRLAMQCPLQEFVFGYRTETDGTSPAPNRAVLSTIYEYDHCEHDASNSPFDWTSENARMASVLNGKCTAVATTDRDGDGVLDQGDNCPNDPNTDQANRDHDRRGDVCDLFPLDDQNDIDCDGIGVDRDSCPTQANIRSDRDHDGIDDVCDTVDNR